MTNLLARYDYGVRVTMPSRKRMEETTIDTVEPQRRAMVAQMLAARGFNNANQTKERGWRYD